MIILTDIHGNFDTMVALLAQIPQEEKDKGIAICGDLVDRGPRSRQIVQYCIDNDIKVVMGNHEEMMIDEGLKEASYFLKNHTFNYFGGGNSLWGVNGGFETLESYIIHDEEHGKLFAIDDLQDHIEWMKNLPYYLEFKDVKNDEGRHLLITHSSASKVWKWSDERRKQHSGQFNSHLTWNRDNRICDIVGIFNVFGHTPQPNGAKIKSIYANIDTGCFYNGEPGYNTLTALQYPEMIIYTQENVDRAVPKSVFGEIDNEDE